MHPASDLVTACPKCFTGYIVRILLILLACITIPILTPSTVRNFIDLTRTISLAKLLSLTPYGYSFVGALEPGIDYSH